MAGSEHQFQKKGIVKTRMCREKDSEDGEEPGDQVL